MAMLVTVYGFAPGLDGRPGERVEFSLHPLVAGVRQTHTIVWEREQAGPARLASRLTWPNRFSRFLGDKAFGLLVADLLGLPVPATTVVGRRVAPFSFGRPTGSGERWTRTCPAEPVPGRFLTERGWRDPFALLASEDPSGAELVAVLAQEGVRAAWSGAAIPAETGPAGRGVPGPGDFCCLGRRRARPGAGGLRGSRRAAGASARSLELSQTPHRLGARSTWPPAPRPTTSTGSVPAPFDVLGLAPPRPDRHVRRLCIEITPPSALPPTPRLPAGAIRPGWP